MPLYVFVCEKCQQAHEFVRPIAERNQPAFCPQCGKTMARSPRHEHVASANVDYEKPVLSESMGVTPGQVAERRARFPNIPHTDDGRVIIKNHAELKQFSKQLGFHDRNGYG